MLVQTFVIFSPIAVVERMNREAGVVACFGCSYCSLIQRLTDSMSASNATDDIYMTMRMRQALSALILGTFQSPVEVEPSTRVKKRTEELSYCTH